jgi:hypothetical protein
MRITFGLALALTLASTMFSQAQEPAQGARGARGGGGRGAAPEPRIVTFEARPSSVRPGQPVLLVWATENPAGAPSIQPELGSVTPRGSRQVTPLQTTTFTLTLRNGATKSVTVTVAGAPASSAQPASTASSNVSSKVPRMPDGKPDFTGVYGSAGLPATAKAPGVKPGAEKFVIVRGPNDVRGRTTLYQECVPLGIPQTYITPYPWQFIQTGKLLIQVFEYPMAVRFIPLDGRPLPVDPDPSWMGTAAGRWQGDTLVIESTGYNDKTEVHGFMHTQDLRVVERFRKLEDGNLQYEVTVEDPNVWVTPWAIPARTFQLRREAEWVDEFVCDAPPVDYRKLFGK